MHATPIKIQVMMKKIILLLTMLALSSCSSPTDQQLVQTARQYLTQTKLRTAVIDLKNALQKNPKNAEARYLLGEIYLKTGDPVSAENEFKRAADAGWSEEKVHIGLARAMLERHNWQKLLGEKVKGSYSVSARANLYALQALAQTGLGHFNLARQLQEKAGKLDANALYVLISAIRIQLATSSNISDANKSLRQALISYGRNQQVLLLSAIVAMSNKDQAAAASAFSKVIALEPHNLITLYGHRARLGLARLEILKGHLKSAESTLKPLFKQNANDPETNYVGGLLAFRQGKLELAQKRLLLVLKVAPAHTQTQLLFGAVSYAQHHYEQAAYYLARYVSVVQDNLGARKLLGRTYIKLGQNKKAQAALQPGLKNNSGDAELLALVSLSQLQAGDTVSGIKGLQQAIKIAPANLALRNELARVYIATGETKNAIRMLHTLLEKDGDKKQTQVLLISTYLKAEQYNQAIDVVLSMLHEYPHDPAIMTLAGNVFVISNDRSEARKYFNRALQLNPGYLPAAMLLARLEELDGHADKAEQMYKKLAQANKKDINALMALARLAKVHKQPEEMVKWLQQAAKRLPTDLRSRQVLAEYYLREKQFEKVAQILQQLMNISPEDNALLVLQARLQIAKGQYDAALSSLNKLVTKVPESGYARTLLAEVYFKLGQQTNARRQLDIVLEKQPYYVMALLLRAKLALQSHHFDKVLSYAGRIQKVQPDLYLGYELMGDAQMNKKNYSAAKTSYGQAWQYKPSADLAIKRSVALSRAGKLTEATEPLLVWLDRHPDDARVSGVLGMAYQNLKQNNKAIKIFEKILIKQPDNIIALNNLAWLYSLVNNPKALELAARAYKLKPQDSGIQDTYGWILVQQGQVDKGLKLLESAIQVLSAVPEVQYHYAVALIKSGKKTKGQKILSRLLKQSKHFEGRDKAKQLQASAY